MTRQRRPPPGPPEALMNEAALRRWLEKNLPLDEPGQLGVERHRAGHSNETFFIRWGYYDLVLRRPPAGAFLPTAHDVLREYRILRALHGSGVRAPRVLLQCEDPGVLGAPFYLMERVEGHIIRTDLPQALDNPQARRRIGEDLIDALAELHAVDWQQRGLERVGKTTGYLERQVRRWAGQLELTRPHTINARDVPELIEVGRWLVANIPTSARTTLVHGDYKLDNVAFADDGRLVAIFDWEMATVGDPLADLGWLLSFWREAADPVDDLLSISPRITERDGFPTRHELVARYETRTGATAENLPFYLALAVWKLAILLEGSFARHLTGVTDDPLFAEIGRAVPALGRRALALTQKEPTA